MNKPYALLIFLVLISFESAKAVFNGDSLKNPFENAQFLLEPSKDYNAAFTESMRLILNDNIDKGARILTDTYTALVRKTNVDRVLDYQKNEWFSIILGYCQDELNPGEKKLGKMFIKEMCLPLDQSFDQKINQYLKDYPKSIFINRISVFFGSLYLDINEENIRINKLIALDPLCLGGNTLKGEILKKQKIYDESITYFSKAIEKFPEYSYAFTMRGLCNTKKDQYNSAFVDFTQAINLWPRYDSAFYWRGNARAELKQYELSIPDYHRAIELNPKFDLAYNNMALSFKHLSLPDSAAYYFDKAISIHPTYAEYYANKGELYWGIEEYKKCIWCYDRAIDLDPSSSALYDNRGNAYYWDKEPELALKDYKKAMEIDGNDVHAICCIGESYYNMADYAQAIYYCKLALQINPQIRHEWLILGLSYEKSKNYPSQVTAFKRALDLDTTNISSLTNLGWAYYNINDFEKCIYYSAKAMKYNDKAYAATFNYALSMLRIGKIKESKNMYRKCLDNYTQNEKESENFNKLPEGVMEDLRNLLDKNIQVDDVRDILKNIFGQ